MTPTILNIPRRPAGLPRGEVLQRTWNARTKRWDERVALRTEQLIVGPDRDAVASNTISDGISRTEVALVRLKNLRLDIEAQGLRIRAMRLDHRASLRRFDKSFRNL